MAKQQQDLKRDTDQILQGIRIVLPGTQALIGFQFIAFFNPTFQQLTTNLKGLHFVALLLAITCSILLIAPVSFQQIGEDGNPTPAFLKFTRKMLSFAMLCLLLAIVGDVFMAARLINLGNLPAGMIAALILSLGAYLWFAHSLVRRNSA